jgi:hypothetical protein
MLDNDQIITDKNVILSKQSEYYQVLYQDVVADNERTKAETENFLNTPNIPGLDEQEKNMLDMPITYKEVADAVKELPTQKSPGSDGFPAEFYKFFWSKISKLVYNSINQAMQTNHMSIDQRRAVLNIIPKKGKDIRRLKNWRPLSLLNTDYKIMAKILALRLRKVLPNIISYDQSGCIEGRSTFSNIRSTIDVVKQAQETKANGILAFIDYEKAFDTVRWDFLYKCLERLNFGEFYIKCIKTLYNDIETCVTNNGHASPFFKPTRGIRQGCPVSANLFVSIVEILAHAIRQNPNIIGLLLGTKEYKISQFADDTCLYLSDENSLQSALTVIENFTVCSGLKLNRDKSEAIWIAASSNFLHKPCRIKWTKSATSLGVKIGNDLPNCIDENYRDKISIIENLTKQWCLRKLTLKGKVVIVNTLLLSQLLYLGSCVSTPQWVIARYKEIITNFIWNNKPPKVKYTTMIGKIEDGGLNLQDLESKIRATKINWIKKLADENYKAPWKANVEQYFKDSIQEVVKHNCTKEDYPVFTDKFYTEMWHIWAELHHQEPSNLQQVCNQRLCNNSYVRVNCRPMQRREWTTNNLIFVKDIITDKGTFLTETNINRKFNIRLKQLDYNSLITAIPKKWKKILKIAHTDIPNIIPENDCTLEINKINKDLQDVTTKHVYSILLNKIFKRATSEKKWNDTEHLDIDEADWKNIYQNASRLTADTKIQTFQFKITHRILACKLNLRIWKIEENDICNKCNTEIDTIEHHLVMCTETLEFWSQVRNWWQSITGANFAVGIYDLIFGLPNEENDKIINQFNFLLLFTRYYIYANKQAARTNLQLYELLISLKTRLELMQNTAREQNNEKKFEAEWGELANGI